MSYKPENYSAVSPYLVVNGAAGTIEFLVNALGGEELRRFENDGVITHAEVRLDDSVIMLADGGHPAPPFPSHVHIYVPDVDAAYQRALDAGATSVQEPSRRDSSDTDKRGGVVDAGGTTWWLATQQT